MPADQATIVARREGLLPVGLITLSGLFFLSGISGLLYEVVWQRMLTRLLGSTVYATSTVLAAYMGGLGAGSFLAGRLVDRARRPLRLYALLEFGIGAAAALSLGLHGLLFPVYRTLHDWAGASPFFLMEVRLVTALLFLLVPTTLMGATLPTLSAIAGHRHPHFARYVGTLYAMNNLGAVVGVLLAGFVLIGAIGERGTVGLGVALNVAVTLGVLSLGRGHPSDDPEDDFEGEGIRSGDRLRPDRGRGPHSPEYPARVRRTVLRVVAVCGFISLASEVVWGRMLLLYQGTSVYAFCAMLAVLLAGMGIGSLVGGRVANGNRDPLRLLAHLQLAVGLAGLLSLHLFDRGGSVKPDLESGTNLGGMILAPILFLGPMGFLWGMIFPVATHCYTASPEAVARGRSVAELYTWNTLGGIAGAAMGGFALVPMLGISATGTALAAGSFLLCLVLLRIHPSGFWRETRLAMGCLVTAFGFLILTVGDPYFRLLLRSMERVFPGQVIVYRHTEGPAATTTAFGMRNGDSRSRHLWIDGQGMTALVPTTKLMAHLPLWLADGSRDALVVCFGMGTTVRSASRHGGLEVWAVELIPDVIGDAGYFHPDVPSLLRLPNIHPVAEDGRNFLLLNPRLYDVITVDPAPPLYSAGAVNLYSREFFQLGRAHLRPGGVMCLWVPEGNATEVKAIMRTFLDVFEHVSIWESPLREPGSSGFYLIGADRPFENLEKKIRHGYLNPEVVADLKEWGEECDSPEKVLGLYLGDERAMRPLLSDSPVISDDRPYTEFPLWRARSRGGAYHERYDGSRLRQQLRIRSNAP